MSWDEADVLFRSGRALRFPVQATATALVYYHKYCTFCEQQHKPVSSLPTSSKTNLFIAILFLAGKATENIRRIREVLNVVRFLYGGNRPEELGLRDYQSMKEAVVEQEHHLLRILAFNTEMDLPHAYLLNMARYLQLDSREVKCAWMYLNGSLYDRQIVSVPPSLVAVACLYLGCETCRDTRKRDESSKETTGTRDTKWWLRFEVTESQLHHTCTWVQKAAEYKPTPTAVANGTAVSST
jgi:hypothetical protein